jgi:Na+-translocating ferredoxin:NAD+ oxidoreductase RnfG subunit
MRAALRALACVGALLAPTVTALSAQALLSREEALAQVFPGATTTSERVFLTADQMKAAADRAGVAIPSALVGRYLATKNGAPVGRAYVDTHVVRTKKETVLIALDAAGTVKRVDVIAMLEPPEYRAPQPFLGQFAGRRLQDDLRLQRAIRPIAGATLTATAVTDAVRRVLAIDAVLTGGSAPQGPSR